jgi:hypothetical protein
MRIRREFEMVSFEGRSAIALLATGHRTGKKMTRRGRELLGGSFNVRVGTGISTL